MSLAWRSPRSIPTGQDGRRPLQHKLKVTYIYVLKCITHPPPLRTELPFSFRQLRNPPGLAIHSRATRTPNFIIIISAACPASKLPGCSREFCKSKAPLGLGRETPDTHAPAANFPPDPRLKINSIDRSTVTRARLDRRGGGGDGTRQIERRGEIQTSLVDECFSVLFPFLAILFNFSKCNRSI